MTISAGKPVSTTGIPRGALALLGGLVSLPIIGIIALLIFVNSLLRPGQLDTWSLPLVAIAAGLAATFNPCALPTLPGLLTGFAGGGKLSVRARFQASAGGALGAMSVLALIGLLIALLGRGTGAALAPHVRWVHLGAGSLLVILAGAHVAGRTTNLLLSGRIIAVGARLWEQATTGPLSFRRAGALGAGFVAIGFG